MFIYLEVFPGIGLAVDGSQNDGKDGKCEKGLHFLFYTFKLAFRQNNIFIKRNVRESQ
jgi:hypothetical protein